jgi:hypothetical protein
MKRPEMVLTATMSNILVQLHHGASSDISGSCILHRVRITLPPNKSKGHAYKAMFTVTFLATPPSGRQRSFLTETKTRLNFAKFCLCFYLPFPPASLRAHKQSNPFRSSPVDLSKHCVCASLKTSFQAVFVLDPALLLALTNTRLAPPFSSRHNPHPFRFCHHI